ncbi:MAG: hypothetical protein KC486_14650 [Myxococcales bacterium]|nr:hypothetical protein [Myxococcales bacterium]
MRLRSLSFTLVGACALGLLAGACMTASSFACTGDAECTHAGAQGVCEDSGFCSFPDESCASGRRYGEFSGNGLGGACVDGAGSDSATSTATTSTGSTTEPTTSTTDEPTTTTTAGGCSELGGSCGDAGDCCDPCMACSEGMCVANVGAQAPCETCEACDENAQCAPQPEGSSCTYDCSALLWGAEAVDGTLSCYRRAANDVSGMCEADGTCAAVNAKDCPEDQGEFVVSCDDACAHMPHDCVGGEPAEGITVESLCVVDGEAQECKSGCVNDSFGVASCDASGACVVEESTDCAPYTCNADGCLDTCNNSMQCAEGFGCTNKMCM